MPSWDAFLLDSFADREADSLWCLSERKALATVEKGGRVSELREFLGSCDSQPLPESVEAFLNSVERRGAACLCQGTCLLIECITPEIAAVIAGDARAGALCRRAGDRGLVVPVAQEEAFRGAINGLGFGMPRV